MDIDTDTSKRDLAILSGVSRHSEQRRDELQRLANILTARDIQIKVTFEERGAFANPAHEDELHDFEIHIPVETFEQVETDMPDRLWGRRVQVGLLFHELGHVLYSDFEGYQQRSEQIQPPYKEVFRTVYNAAEDVVIEAQIANEFTLERDFVTLNETFQKLQVDDQQRYIDLFDDSIGDHFSFTVFEALRIGILAQGFGSDPRFGRILDETDDTHRIHDNRRDVLVELAPHLEAFVNDMLTIRDGGERVDRAVQFYQRVKEFLMDLPTVQTVRLQTEGFRPMEAGTYVIQDPKEATALPESPEEGRNGTTGEENDRATDSSVGTHPGATDTDESRDHSPGEDGRPRDRSSGRDERDSGIDTLLGATDDKSVSPLQQDAEQLLEIIQSDETQVRRARVVEINEGDGNPHRWKRAREQAKQLAADLRSALRRQRRADVQPGHRTGQVDPQRIVQAVQGRDRVFRKRAPGDQRDYSCLIVLDRSGSMNGQLMEAAEDATVQLVHALHDVGVEVSVLSLLGNQPCLELPFGGEPHQFADHLTSMRTFGGTPLTAAIEIARNHVTTGSGYEPFVVVVTDGAPDDTDRYTAEIDRCNFDVYGIYIDGTPGMHAQYFDRIVYAQPGEVDSALRELARRIVG